MLAATRLYLICGNEEQALKSLKQKRRYKWHAKEATLLSQILKHDMGEDFHEVFQEYFDFMRTPVWLEETEYYREGIMASIDLALIAVKYIDKEAWPPDPHMIIERISA